ncbi:MAG: hypothetical protein Hyperionvirus3_94 [Hyperionvirus sp.]|uniref:Uncharacterized protein n=1 Tax=Hyperionvirus sp. TaxID=2487770 RepID=A0A3G5A6Z7_9VIRU|nr:MAG: hypothetical protein Hyperionvirus3_94 [Hyperionvirus sp.]
MTSLSEDHVAIGVPSSESTTFGGSVTEIKKLYSLRELQDASRRAFVISPLLKRRAGTVTAIARPTPSKPRAPTTPAITGAVFPSPQSAFELPFPTDEHLAAFGSPAAASPFQRSSPSLTPLAPAAVGSIPGPISAVTAVPLDDPYFSFPDLSFQWSRVPPIGFHGASAQADSLSRKRHLGTNHDDVKTKIARGINHPSYPGEIFSVEKMPDNIEERISLHKKRITCLKSARILNWSISRHNENLRSAKFTAYIRSPDHFKKDDYEEPCSIEGEPDLIDDALKFHEDKMTEAENILIKIKLWKMIGTVADIVDFPTYNRFCRDLETITNTTKGLPEIKSECKRSDDIKKYIQLIITEKRYVLPCFKEAKIPDSMVNMPIVEEFIEDLHKRHNQELIDSWYKLHKIQIDKNRFKFVPSAKPCKDGCMACRYQVRTSRIDITGINFRDLTYFDVMSDKFVGSERRERIESL